MMSSGTCVAAVCMMLCLGKVYGRESLSTAKMRTAVSAAGSLARFAAHGADAFAGNRKIGVKEWQRTVYVWGHELGVCILTWIL